VFTQETHSALRAVVLSLRGNSVPMQTVTDAIGSAVETVETEAIQRYASRVRETGRRFKADLLGQGFLPGIDDRPEPIGPSRRIVRSATAEREIADRFGDNGKRAE
jgi:hypothetical protein